MPQLTFEPTRAVEETLQIIWQRSWANGQRNQEGTPRFLVHRPARAYDDTACAQWKSFRETRLTAFCPQCGAHARRSRRNCIEHVTSVLVSGRTFRCSRCLHRFWLNPANNISEHTLLLTIFGSLSLTLIAAGCLLYSQPDRIKSESKKAISQTPVFRMKAIRRARVPVKSAVPAISFPPNTAGEQTVAAQKGPR